MLEADDNLQMNTPHLHITLFTDSSIYKDMYGLTSDEGMYCTVFDYSVSETELFKINTSSTDFKAPQ